MLQLLTQMGVRWRTHCTTNTLLLLSPSVLGVCLSIQSIKKTHNVTDLKFGSRPSHYLQTSGVCNSLIAYSRVPRRPRPSFSTTYRGKVFKSLLNLLFSCKYESRTPPSMILSISCISQTAHLTRHTDTVEKLPACACRVEQREHSQNVDKRFSMLCKYKPW